jgi:hypothetical protein
VVCLQGLVPGGRLLLPGADRGPHQHAQLLPGRERHSLAGGKGKVPGGLARVDWRGWVHGRGRGCGLRWASLLASSSWWVLK